VRSHSPEYEQYLKSKAWKLKREEALKRAGYHCQGCGKPFLPSKLDAHHLTYERLGHERPSDLRVLCATCHVECDAARANRTYERRWAAWANKVYGDDWPESYSPEEMRDLFDRWVDHKTETDECADGDESD
jgi:hypothetical protein